MLTRTSTVSRCEAAHGTRIRPHCKADVSRGRYTPVPDGDHTALAGPGATQTGVQNMQPAGFPLLLAVLAVLVPALLPPAGLADDVSLDTMAAAIERIDERMPVTTPDSKPNSASYGRDSICRLQGQAPGNALSERRHQPDLRTLPASATPSLWHEPGQSNRPATQHACAARPGAA